MAPSTRFAPIFTALLLASSRLWADPLPRSEWGAPDVTVSHTGQRWRVEGRRNHVTLNETNLALSISSGGRTWSMLPSGKEDMLVNISGKKAYFRLTDAGEIRVAPYDTGFRTGVKLSLSKWNGLPGVTLFLTIGLEGRDEELVCDVVAQENAAGIERLDWPTALDAHDVDFTLLSNGRGNLLPRDWPKEYFPIRSISNGKVSTKDHSVLQSHVIEDWSMSWWGFQKGKAAMMAIIETPDDAAYQFAHPAGGPTVVGPRWRESLGKLAYLRTVRFCFFDNANYVTLAKRYRRYVMDTGLFVSLKEKIARTPILADLMGTPQTRVHFLTNQKEDSDRYNPTNHYSVIPFEEQARRLRELKARGIEHAIVFASAWGHLGYDRQHPDPLPPAEAAGGWEGMKSFADACRELGYPYIFHDQYRDYYVDAPSYDTQFAIHEEDDSSPATAFAGSRFGDWKEGQVPFMRHWDGGKQSYLNARFQPGHLRKNYELFFAHGIHPQGIYIDVIGYVPPDEDFNPEHPTTRTEAMRGQAELLTWARHNLGFTATEAGSDWVIPYVDCVNQSGAVGKCVPLPLYNLVYHDAVLISFGAARTGGQKNLLLGILYGGVPELPLTEVDEQSLSLIKQMAALHKRIGLLEMTNHEFLDAAHQQERTTFADGTTVTVDWSENAVSINPPLE